MFSELNNRVVRSVTTRKVEFFFFLKKHLEHVLKLRFYQLNYSSRNFIMFFFVVEDDKPEDNISLDLLNCKQFFVWIMIVNMIQLFVSIKKWVLILIKFKIFIITNFDLTISKKKLEQVNTKKRLKMRASV